MYLYIAGPMSGVPQFNVPLFDEVAKKLRAAGDVVVSPAELDSWEMREACMASPDGNMKNLTAKVGETWGDLLARDVKMIADNGIEGIVLLPGWRRSRGATLEATVGLLSHLQFYLWAEHAGGAYGLVFMPSSDVLFNISRGFHERWGERI